MKLVLLILQKLESLLGAKAIYVANNDYGRHQLLLLERRHHDLVVEHSRPDGGP